jgi:hypothetical protein
MRESTANRVEQLIQRSRADNLKLYGSADAGMKVIEPIALRLSRVLIWLPLATRVAVCTCVLEATLEVYADEVDSGHARTAS